MFGVLLLSWPAVDSFSGLFSRNIPFNVPSVNADLVAGTAYKYACESNILDQNSSAMEVDLDVVSVVISFL